MEIGVNLDQTTVDIIWNEMTRNFHENPCHSFYREAAFFSTLLRDLNFSTEFPSPKRLILTKSGSNSSLCTSTTSHVSCKYTPGTPWASLVSWIKTGMMVLCLDERDLTNYYWFTHKTVLSSFHLDPWITLEHGTRPPGSEEDFHLGG